jgi:hypothetical protein
MYKVAGKENVFTCFSKFETTTLQVRLDIKQRTFSQSVSKCMTEKATTEKNALR